MDEKHVVIIGGVAAGLKAAAKVRRGDQSAIITVVEKGDLVSYGACGMPYVVGKDIDSIEHLMMTPSGKLRNPDFFKNRKNIDIKIRTEAIAINRAVKTVRVKNMQSGEESDLPYDQLVIATGSNPIKIAFPGVELGNIFQMWHPYDAQGVRLLLESGKVKSAVIIGAGLVGVEMAEAFRHWDIQTAIVEMKETMLPAMLDEEIGQAVAKYAAEQGISIRTLEKVERFNGDGVVREVVTDKGVIPADVVILTIGVKPNIALAKEAGLKIGVTGAIEVNEHMQTSDPDIFAGGDCAENVNMITGKKAYVAMGSIANKHGRVIGENICGDAVKFRGVLGTVAVKLLELNIGKTGLTEREAKAAGYEYVTALLTGPDRAHYMPGSKPITLKLIVDVTTRKVIGLQAFGEGEAAKRIDVVATLLTMGGTIDDLFDADLSYAPPYNSPIDLAAVAANSVMNKLAVRDKDKAPLAAKEAGVMHIPIDELHKRLDELKKDGEVVAFCRISTNGYEAECLLEGEDLKLVGVHTCDAGTS